MINDEQLKALPCPFCGHPVDMDDEDTIYPNGTGWKPSASFGRSYHNFREVPKSQWCYVLRCVNTSGGCGAEMHGDSKIEVINKWNRRV